MKWLILISVLLVSVGYGKVAKHLGTLSVSRKINQRKLNFSMKITAKNRGWGAVRVQVTISQSIWETSIFPHKESSAYILPVKAAVRKTEKIQVGDEVLIGLAIKI